MRTLFYQISKRPHIYLVFLMLFRVLSLPGWYLLRHLKLKPHKSYETPFLFSSGQWSRRSQRWETSAATMLLGKSWFYTSTNYQLISKWSNIIWFIGLMNRIFLLSCYFISLCISLSHLSSMSYSRTCVSGIETSALSCWYLLVPLEVRHGMKLWDV